MHGEQSGGRADTPRYRTGQTGEFMGIFDKVEKDAEEAMAQDEPRLAQRADGPLGAAQAAQDMQAARNLIGQQRGARDRDQDQDGSDQDYSDEDW